MEVDVENKLEEVPEEQDNNSVEDIVDVVVGLEVEFADLWQRL